MFGFWAMVLMVAMFLLEGAPSAIDYIESRNFTEPMFVFAIMVIAGTRPVLLAASGSVRRIARALPLPGSTASYVAILALVPLLGSFITEPAAMTLAALMAARSVFHPRHLDPAQVRHPRRAFCKRLDRRHADSLRCAPGADGGGQMGLEHRLHAGRVRLEIRHRGDHQRHWRDPGLPARTRRTGDARRLKLRGDGARRPDSCTSRLPVWRRWCLPITHRYSWACSCSS